MGSYNWPASFRIFLTSLRFPPAVLISFAAFVFVGLNTHWQKESFELRNRPYVQIVKNYYNFRLSALFRTNEETPEAEIKLSVKFLNHGPVPASIKNVYVKASLSKEDLLNGNGVVIGPNEKDRIEQWTNYDVFPFVSKEITNEEERQITGFLNPDDLGLLLGKEISGDDIVKNSRHDTYTGLEDSPYLNGLNGRPLPDIFLLIQLRYSALGELRNDYFYCVLLKNHIWESHFVQSGTDHKLKRAGYVSPTDWKKILH